MIRVALAVSVSIAFSAVAAPTGPDTTDFKWMTVGADGNAQVQLYFFWSKRCPHCNRARPFIEALPNTYPWVKVHSLELTEHKDNVILYMNMAAALGQNARSVPAFIFCGMMGVGYDDHSTTGADIKTLLEQCHQQVAQHSANTPSACSPLASQEPPLHLPWIGKINSASLSLPVFTLVLAGLDSFNPCAFFVLLFLLSLLVHARSRARMLIIGGTFVFFSGFIYFLFMAAWLNLFMVIGQLGWVTLLAGILAVLLALVNIKDYFWYQRGVTLSIPETAKPNLYQRMRGLLNAEHLPTMLVGAMVLAIAANSYELLCTAGFPMVFTRILTLNELSMLSYYLHLGFCNLIYVVPLLLIVIAFAMTMGARKLQQREGQALKLLSGLMMFELGVVLLIVPEALDNVLTALALLVAAIALTLAVVRLTRGLPTDRGLGPA